MCCMIFYLYYYEMHNVLLVLRYYFLCQSSLISGQPKATMYLQEEQRRQLNAALYAAGKQNANREAAEQAHQRGCKLRDTQSDLGLAARLFGKAASLFPCSQYERDAADAQHLVQVCLASFAKISSIKLGQFADS